MSQLIKNTQKRIRKRSKRFTFITEYQGGTYIYQGTGKDLLSVHRKWLKHAFKVWRPKGVELEMDKSAYVPVDGIKNVWCGTGLIGKKLVLVNVVESV